MLLLVTVLWWHYYFFTVLVSWCCSKQNSTRFCAWAGEIPFVRPVRHLKPTSHSPVRHNLVWHLVSSGRRVCREYAVMNSELRTVNSELTMVNSEQFCRRLVTKHNVDNGSLLWPLCHLEIDALHCRAFDILQPSFCKIITTHHLLSFR